MHVFKKEKEMHFKYNINGLKVRWWSKICQANINKKKGRVAILVSGKLDFKTRKIINNKESFYIMITTEQSIHEDNITLNEYAPSNTTSNYIKQKLIELREV